MQKPLFISTDRDMPQLRKSIISWLRKVQQLGGPSFLYYEDFLPFPDQSYTDTSINKCLLTAKNTADGGYVVINKTAGSPILGNEDIAKSTKLDLTTFIEQNRKHILDAFDNKIAPNVSWGEAYCIEQNGKQLFASIHTDTLALAQEYRRISKNCKYQTKDEIIELLKKLFIKFGDIKEKNTDVGSSSSSSWILKMVVLCEYVSWFVAKNLNIIPWSTEEDVIGFFNKRYEWASIVSLSSSFWINGKGSTLSMIKRLGQQLHGQIWIWNSDLRILRSREWVESIYLPLAQQYSRVKIAVPIEIYDQAKTEWRSILLTNLDLINSEASDKTIEIGIIEENLEKQSLVAVFGVESELYEDKKIAMITPYIDGYDHDCTNFVVEPSNENPYSLGEAAFLAFLQKDMNAKMEKIEFTSLREVLSA